MGKQQTLGHARSCHAQQINTRQDYDLGKP